MGLGDVTGVFSRYFLVGFFLPAYISLIALWFFASTEFIPDALESQSQGTQLLILGGVALVAALALSGLNYDIIRAFEGYPLERMAQWPVVGRLYRAAFWLQARSYNKLRAVRDGNAKLPTEVQEAAWNLEQFFPHQRDRLLPTRMGNAIRAFERHSNERWGLDGITIWPRIEALLSADERGLHVDAKIDLNVFINGALGAVVVGVCLVFDKAFNAPHPAWDWPLYAIPFVLGYALYRATLGAAVRWGDAVRSSVDLHRLELYEKLGVRAPLSFSDEREMAPRLNKALLYGRPLLGDDLWRKDESASSQSAPSALSRIVNCLRKCRQKEGRP